MATERTVTRTRKWTDSDARALIHEIIADLAPSRGELLPEARLVEDLGCHSLALLELAFSLEDEFDLPAIDEATARQILTVGDVERHVLGQLRTGGNLAGA